MLSVPPWVDMNIVGIISSASAAIYLIFAVWQHFRNEKKKETSEGSPPWTLSRLDIDTWELERLKPQKVTLYGYSIVEEYSDEYGSKEGEIKFSKPSTSFGKGTKLPFRTSENIDQCNYTLNIFYRAHGKKSKPVDLEDWHGDIGNRPVPDDVKVWSARI